jgi:glycosyltransferase involved in cell wall biosynthesis
MKEIYPLILESMPNLKIHLVGSDAAPDIEAYTSENVRIAGYVPNVKPCFQSARVFVAPLRFGAGVKGKIGDALSFGLPVVTTSVGADGMGLQNGEQALIADDPREFARAVLRLYQDGELWQRLADNGYAHIEEYFSPQAIEKTILAAINLETPEGHRDSFNTQAREPFQTQARLSVKE